MKWTSLNELREKYLSFFESKGHLRLPSFSLIPKDDNSLLLINSGMAPMKKYFTGEATPPRRRVTTCQKCIRTPDIDLVGKTARHGTYFEMLGNFSFGDYFKKEAISWAWEFCTEVLQMPKERLWVSIYENDDEAFEIWTKHVGVAPERVVRLGKSDNFWEHGPGPCGPCSEIYFDRGEHRGCRKPGCGVGCDCDRFVEFWNLVFTQLDSDGKGTYTPLSNPNIDTGMGLERLACIMQDVDNLFEVDTVRNIMNELGKIAGIQYKSDPKTDVSMRVITDHIRSITFMIADGVMPSNEGRGYVLRRLLRRAARHGRLLGIKHAFLKDLFETVIEENKTAYPEIVEKKDFIKKVISVEEENFGRTIDQGLQLLEDLMNTGSTVLSGEDAFKLYDTYGFPLDLTKDILAEKGMTVDEDTFNKLMKEQRERARKARKDSESSAWKSENGPIEGVEPTEFVGYKQDSCDCVIKAIIVDGQPVSEIKAGEKGIIVLDKTPFYAESGGQVGDTGFISNIGGKVRIVNTTKNADEVFLHEAVAESGILRVNELATAMIDVERRMAIRRNHTAAHLLQNALRRVLGNHVQQAGQHVDETHVRFDFTHFSALTAEELKQVEAEVNNTILSGYEVKCEEMPIERAKELGALALFGEKYGDTVRVVSAGESIELCGGTHIDNTAKIGLFRIISENSVASGVRRIEAYTGKNVLGLLDKYLNQIIGTAEALKTANPDDIMVRAELVMRELKEKEKAIQKLQEEIAGIKLKNLISQAKTIGEVKFITAIMPGAGADEIRAMCDKVKAENDNAVALIASISDNKVTFAAACGKKAVNLGAHAGNLVKGVAQVTGGNGGGRPDSAMAGGKDTSKVEEAISQGETILRSQLKL
ncbi:MAG TPA: alanine--tRNA ligase [Clostridiales bacterium]|nr:alanine--tRNA ligase [Clostridiales bacterium]